MKYYSKYMDRQTVSEGLHERLLVLDPPKRAGQWQRYAAMAACAAVIVGLGVWRWTARVPESSNDAVDILSQMGVLGDHCGDPTELPDIPYPNLKNGDMAADIALPDGAITVELLPHQLEEVLESPNLVLPGVWGQDASVRGQAIYDGYGALWLVSLRVAAENGDEAYIELAPGEIPPTCIAGGDGAVTEVNGVDVRSWGAHYDSNGDGVKEYHYNSAFLAGDIGVRAQFKSIEESSDSTMFIWYVVNGGVSLEAVSQLEDVPEFRAVWFDDYGEALKEADFAAYLPEALPEGFGEFGGKLVYQEGIDNHLVVWWRRGQDRVHLYINRPEGGASGMYTPVDISAADTWDLRLHSGDVWGEEVPFETLNTLAFPTFRAEDVTLDVICGRKEAKADSYQFHVLYPDGTGVEYSIYGLTVDEVWDIISPTLA